MIKKTVVQKIFEQMNLLSNSDFQSWMLNNIDDLLSIEFEQMQSSFCEGSKLIECPNELSAQFEFIMYWIDTYKELEQ